jgi:hypothetical protein
MIKVDFSETGPYVAQAGLECSSFCLNFPNSGTTDVCHHSWLYKLGYSKRLRTTIIKLNNYNNIFVIILFECGFLSLSKCGIFHLLFLD